MIDKLQIEGNNEIERALWQVNGARSRLLETLADVKDKLIDWQPEASANSVGTLLYHIAAIEADWLYVEVLQRPFPPEIESILPWPVRDENGRLYHVTGQTLAEHLARLTAVRQALMAGFEEITPEQFRSLSSFEHYDVTPEWVLFHLTQHETEHRGQIQELTRQAKEVMHGQSRFTDFGKAN